MKKGVYIFWAIIGLIVVLGIASSLMVSSRPGQYDALAQCIRERGTVFYGAFWCPHCQATKRLFGASAKFLPYVECSTPDGQRQTQICKDKGIQSYPTWIRPDGAIILGEHTVADIAAFAGCTLDGQPTAFSSQTASSSESSSAAQ